MENQIVLEIPKKLLTANQIRWYGNFIKSGVIEIDNKLNSCQTHPMHNSRGLKKEPSPGGKCIAILRSPIMLLWAGVQYFTFWSKLAWLHFCTTKISTAVRWNISHEKDSWINIIIEIPTHLVKVIKQSLSWNSWPTLILVKSTHSHGTVKLSNC